MVKDCGIQGIIVKRPQWIAEGLTDNTNKECKRLWIV